MVVRYWGGKADWRELLGDFFGSVQNGDAGNKKREQ